jgi:preprotein translocase subunit SecF
MINITGKRFWFFVISLVFILVSLLSLFTFGLKTGIEFTSGSMLTIDFEQKVEQPQLTAELANLGYTDVIIQRTGAGDYLIRTPELNADKKKALEEGLAAKFGKLTETEFDSVSPMIAGETAQNAVIAVAIASIGILLYLTWAFRRMPHPIRYGTCAVIALVHDAFIALGVFSILGGILNWQVNLMFITGILTIIGYSVNNIVVIFDRIRENLRLGISPDFEVVVNSSLIETLGRSLNTIITTLITVFALMFFVGASIQNFVVVLVVGLIAGTFDSICVAPMLLVTWDKKEWGKFVSWLPFAARAKG